MKCALFLWNVTHPVDRISSCLFPYIFRHQVCNISFHFDRSSPRSPTSNPRSQSVARELNRYTTGPTPDFSFYYSIYHTIKKLCSYLSFPLDWHLLEDSVLLCYCCDLTLSSKIMIFKTGCLLCEWRILSTIFHSVFPYFSSHSIGFSFTALLPFLFPLHITTFHFDDFDTMWVCVCLIRKHIY